MSRVHVFRPIMDEAGNLITHASVQVDAEATPDTPTTQTIWASHDITDATQLSNPILPTDGVLDFWLDEPERLVLIVSAAGRPTEVVVVDALPSGSEIVQSSSPLRITNTPAAGEVLTGTAVAGEAEWDTAPAPVLTAEVPGTIYDTGAALLAIADNKTERESVGNELGRLSLIATPGGGPALASYAIDDAPSDPLFTYTTALRIDGEVGEVSATNCFVLSPTMADGGRVEMWVRVASSPGGAKTIVAVQPVMPDSFENYWVRRLAFDPSQDGMWVHLIVEIPDTNDGLVEVLVGETNSQSNDSVSTALAFLQTTSGGVFPPHFHPGAGVQSVMVGTGASAAGDWSVAVGEDADAPEDYNMAVGFDAQATGVESFAVGSSSRATTDQTTAIGFEAEANAIGALSVGHSAEASGVDSVAVGHVARALSADAVAIGADALASAAGALALGSDAQAAAADSIALGTGATVAAAHAGSVAVGKDAASTSSSQIVLGSAEHIVLVQGAWRNLGDAFFGNADSRIGFFGSAGSIKQEVTGSRDGNVALAALLVALDDLGIITDSSTA